MKRLPKWICGIGAVVALSLVLSTSVFAGSSYAFSFSYGNGGYYRPYGGYPGYGYSYSYCPPPVVYYYPAPVVYRYYAPPVYYYYGGGYHCR